MSPLVHYERVQRPARPRDWSILHHGRGTDELDLLGLADMLDPQRRLTIITPRAPLELAGSPGYPLVPRAARRLPRPGDLPAPRSASSPSFTTSSGSETGLGPERTVLGGFSMGSVMSYALGLDAERPRPAGILALSGFMPTVPGWEPDIAERKGLPVFAAHGNADPVIPVELGRARQRCSRRAASTWSTSSSRAATASSPPSSRTRRGGSERVLPAPRPPPSALRGRSA